MLVSSHDLGTERTTGLLSICPRKLALQALAVRPPEAIGGSHREFA